MMSFSRSQILAGTLLTLLAVQCLYFALDNGQTVDETFYNGSGYPMVRYNDYRIMGEHPPLIMQWGSLPLLLVQPKYPIENPIYIGNSDGIDVSKMGSRFLYDMGNNASLILFLERLMVIFLTLVLGIFLYLWAKELYGTGGALLSLTLYSFCPNIIAHGSLFTTDGGLATFYFISLYFLKHFFENISVKNALMVGLFVGLALVSKISALALIPVIICLFIFFYFLGQSNRFQKSTDSTKFNLFLLCLSVFLFLLSLGQKIYMVGIGPICLVVAQLCLSEQKERMSRKLFLVLNSIIWACWIAFPIFLPQIAQKRNFFVSAVAVAWTLAAFIASLVFHKSKKEVELKFLIKTFALVWMVSSLIIIVCYTDFPTTFLKGKPFHHYIRAFNIASNHALAQHKVCVEGSFVTCDWRYFFTLMSIKTPVVTLFFFLLGLLSLWKLKISRVNKAILIIAPGIYLLIASFVNQINIGLRHILPVYPFIFLIAGGLWPLVVGIKNTRAKKITTIFLITGIIYFIVRQLSVNPHNLSYFNEFIGTPQKGALYVADSNLIWGQDNKRLCELAKKLGNPQVKLALSTGNLPELNYYGLNWAPMRESDFINPTLGFYALDINVYTAEQKKQNSWFKGKTPTHRAGQTIFVFEVK